MVAMLTIPNEDELFEGAGFVFPDEQRMLEVWEQYGPESWQNGRCPYRCAGMGNWPYGLTIGQLLYVLKHQERYLTAEVIVQEAIARVQAVHKQPIFRQELFVWATQGGSYLWDGLERWGVPFSIITGSLIPPHLQSETLHFSRDWFLTHEQKRMLDPLIDLVDTHKIRLRSLYDPRVPYNPIDEWSGIQFFFGPGGVE